MDSFNEISLPIKEAFYSDYRHGKRVFNRVALKDPQNKNLGDYHDLHVQSDILLLADVFENFRSKCSEIYELDPAHFLIAPGLAWQASIKKRRVEFELLTYSDTLLMVEEGIRGVICEAIFRYARANNKYMKKKTMMKAKTHHIFSIMIRTLYMLGRCIKNCL